MMTVPDWLTLHDGGLAPGLNQRTWVVTLTGEPEWRLEALPARGTFSCAVVQLNNGKRLDERKEYPSLDTALAGGLEELRGRLGW
jgi:hypothetical protein